jgi:hypothetical protein
MIFFGEDSLRKAIREFVEHYHASAITKGSAIADHSAEDTGQNDRNCPES